MPILRLNLVLVLPALLLNLVLVLWSAVPYGSKCACGAGSTRRARGTLTDNPKASAPHTYLSGLGNKSDLEMYTSGRI